jgi:hypothetical protein
MIALIAYVISALCFLLAALKVKVGSLLLVDWGLFFLVLGLLLGPAIALAVRDRNG